MEVFLEFLAYGIGLFIVGIFIGYQIGKKSMCKILESKER